ncbi:ATPase [Seiridium cupressi]
MLFPINNSSGLRNTSPGNSTKISEDQHPVPETNQEEVAIRLHPPAGPSHSSREEHSDVEAKGADSTKHHAQVLEGVDVAPLAKNSSGTDEAPKLGYPTKLISNWYHHECQHNSCQARWSEFAVVDEDELDLKQRSLEIPIVHRHEYVNKHWVTASITVQDPAMRTVLADVLHKYQDLDLEVENWTFQPPFMPLVHRWETLKAYQLKADDSKLKNAASALLAFLTPILASSVLSLAQTLKTGKADFDSPDAWAIDMKRVLALPVFPISFLADVEKTKTTMIERGRKFEALRGYHYMLSNGTKVLLETEKREQRPVAGKVCIDAYAYYRSCNLVKPILRALYADEDEKDGDEEQCDAEISDTQYETDFTVAPVESASAAKGPAERNEDLRRLTDEHCLLATPWLKGFDMKSKDWCELRVDDLKQMLWNDEAFDKLVLPGGEKDLATFTAEAVAERSRVPLYSMSAGDLGIQPTEVEKALERALELCRMWNAMLLLDEADVFLGARTNESLARNELVSIFLTKLEYYQGILFLTTNRISSIDHAFQSRVDLFLPYHDLEPKACRQVWENFIDRAGRDNFEVDDSSLEKLSHLSLNGRVIKSLIKSAQLLSLKSGGEVPMDRLYMLADKRNQALRVLDGPHN